MGASMGLRILFVEDHGDSRRTLSRLLRYFHHTVVSAPDYQTACSILRQARFDVLLSDIRLPDGDGCDLVRQAKSKQSLVAIALTALGSVRDKERGFSCGFDHYLVKPLDVRGLCTILEGIVVQSR
jgi:DNA-binding response OmpR family regulator